MTARPRDIPDLFEDSALDPVETATGRRKPASTAPDPESRPAASTGKPSGATPKKKAGFYLSVDVLQRFTLKYHELKLAGVAVDNKSTLLELALSFALDDLDKGSRSRVLRKLDG